MEIPGVDKKSIPLLKTNTAIVFKTVDVNCCLEKRCILSLLQNEDFRSKSRHAKKFTAGI
jgi:hypothetical protein